MDVNEIEYFVKYYLKLDIALTIIDKSTNDPNDPSFREQLGSYLKRPTCTIESQDDLKLLREMNDIVGIGLSLDNNNLLCIDFDYCVSDFPIKTALSILGLPIDYEWVIKTGSGIGFHIIVDCNYKTDTEVEIEIPLKEGNSKVCSINSDDLVKLTAVLQRDVNCFRANKKYQYFFEKIELIRFDHSLLPPSLHKSGNSYRFYSNELPHSFPKTVNSNLIHKLISEFCLDENVIDLLVPSRNKIEIPRHIYFQDSYGCKRTIIIDIKTTGLINGSNYYDLTHFPEIIQVAWLVTDGHDIIYSESSLNSDITTPISIETSKSTGVNNQKCKEIGRPLSVIADMLINDLNSVNSISSFDLDFNLECLKNIFFGLVIPMI